MTLPDFETFMKYDYEGTKSLGLTIFAITGGTATFLLAFAQKVLGTSLNHKYARSRFRLGGKPLAASFAATVFGMGFNQYAAALASSDMLNAWKFNVVSTSLFCGAGLFYFLGLADLMHAVATAPPKAESEDTDEQKKKDVKTESDPG